MMTGSEREYVDPHDEIVADRFSEITGLFEQTMLLVGQLFHKIVHQRRYNILSTLIDNSSKVNKLLKEHVTL